MTDCIFCKIVRDEVPSYKVWEDEVFCAFLSIGPLNPGHTLLVTKEHVDYVFDVEEPHYSRLFQSAKHLASPLKNATKSKRIGVLIEGFAVPHAHVHLIPLYATDEINPNRVKQMSAEELNEVAIEIRREIGNSLS